MNSFNQAPIFKLLPGAGGLIFTLLFSPLLHAGAGLHQPEDRITDQAINADIATYKQTQARIAELNNRGIAVSDYHLSKAQCWLDVSLHEYTRNDRSAFPQEALVQSDAILSALDSGQQPDSETPLVNDADRIRTDLWERIASLKSAQGLSCYAQKLACAEVELVHAGNEHKQQGWRHAKPYIQIAEDLVAEAAAIGDSCLSPAVAPAMQTQEQLDISADVLFAFNKAGYDDLLPAGRRELDELVQRLNEVYARVDRITLTGHTDRLGSAQYNQRLSEQRAGTVKVYLQAQGISTEIQTVGRGATEQLDQCGTATKPTRALIDCLQPNRRVTVDSGYPIKNPRDFSRGTLVSNSYGVRI